jgi:hypothetical protein
LRADGAAALRQPSLVGRATAGKQSTTS